VKNNPKILLLKNIAIILIIGALYFVFSLPFARLAFADGAAELRFSGFIPMVSGMLFGPAGALGCALGNFLIDATHTFDVTDLFGTAGVFLMAYLPYKLWHSIFLPARKKPEPAFFDSAASVLKYVGIAFLASVCAAALPATGGQLFGYYSFVEVFPEIALQYFDLSVFAGMLLFQILTAHAHWTPHIPKNAYRQEYILRQYAVDYILLGGAAAASIAMLALSYRAYEEGMRTFPAADALCILLLCVIAVLAALPFTRGGEKTKQPGEYRLAGGLQGQFVSGFLALLCAVLVFYIVTMVMHMQAENETGAPMWIYVLGSAAVACVVMVGILSLLLKWIEAHVTYPVCKTSVYAGNFVKDSELSEGDLAFPKTGNEIDELGESIRHMTRDIRGYVREIKEKTAAEERLATEMSVAGSIQMSLLPRTWNGMGFDVAAEVKPAREVGGDFYDFRDMGEDKAFVAVADVSGKGISASLFMVRAKTLMKARLDLPVSEMMRQLNDELAEQNDAMMFVTVFAGVVDRRAMTFTYANAGHNPPVVFRNGKAEFLVDEPDLAAGPAPGIEYMEHTIPIAEDFRLLLYTDGVTEAQDQSGGFFGESRLRRLAENAFRAGMTARETVCAVRESVEEFVGGAPQADDITALCLSLKKEEA